jgi:hypothetical protein
MSGDSQIHMNDVTRILSVIEAGQPQAADER